MPRPIAPADSSGADLVGAGVTWPERPSDGQLAGHARGHEGRRTGRWPHRGELRAAGRAVPPALVCPDRSRPGARTYGLPAPVAPRGGQDPRRARRHAAIRERRR
eukprot:1298758-Alexandrium_andersonii.AAC.1